MAAGFVASAEECCSKVSCGIGHGSIVDVDLNCAKLVLRQYLRDGQHESLSDRRQARETAEGWRSGVVGGCISGEDLRE